MTSARQAVLAAARSEIGTPYRWGGISASGVDCSGLVYYCCKKVGIPLPQRFTADGLYHYCTPTSSPVQADLVFFGSKSHIHHVGIVSNPGQKLMIDAPHTGAFVHERHYLSDLVAFGQLPKINTTPADLVDLGLGSAGIEGAGAGDPTSSTSSTGSTSNDGGLDVLTKPGTWLRVAEVLGAGVLIVVGAYVVLNDVAPKAVGGAKKVAELAALA